MTIFKRSIRSLHPLTYNPSVASHFILNNKTQTPCYCCKSVQSGLCFSLQLCFVPLPLCSALSSPSGIFLFFWLTRMLLQFGAFARAVPSSSQLFPGPLTQQIPFQSLLHDLNASLSERFPPDHHVLLVLSHYCIPYPPVYFLHST